MTTATANPRSILAWLGMNYDLSPKARNQIMLIAMNDILGYTDVDIVPDPTKPPWIVNQEEAARLAERGDRFLDETPDEDTQ